MPPDKRGAVYGPGGRTIGALSWRQDAPEQLARHGLLGAGQVVVDRDRQSAEPVPRCCSVRLGGGRGGGVGSDLVLAEPHPHPYPIAKTVPTGVGFGRRMD